jgi:hypothetical protein
VTSFRELTQINRAVKAEQRLLDSEKASEWKEARWRQLYWRIEHDVNTPDFPVLSPEDLGWVRHDLGALATPLDDLASALQPLEVDLITRCRKKGSADGASWLADLVEKYVFRPCGRSLGFLRRPENTDLELREAFTAFFLTYRQLREWIPRVAVALQVKEQEFRGYAAWREADRKLFERFHSFPDTPAMRSLRELIRGHQHEGYPQNLNREPTS